MRRLVAVVIVLALAWQSLAVLRSGLHAVHGDIAHAVMHELGLPHEHHDDGSTEFAVTFDAAAHVAADLPAPVALLDVPALVSASRLSGGSPQGPPTCSWSHSCLDGPMRPPRLAT